jgi:hypothetical protein
MIRVSCAVAVCGLALCPSAFADGGGPDPGVMQGWTGVTAPGQPLRYVTLPTGRATVVASVRRSSGRVWGWRVVAGTWGVPMVANDGSVGGLSRDGRLLVLAEWKPPKIYGRLRKTSRFLLVSTKSLKVWRRITLPGDFSYDALSPGGGTLYLIEHLAIGSSASTYRVRAYEIASRRLLPRVIADRRQASWLMNGAPVSRASSSDGRWVYTLYQQPGGYPFVHALDAVHRTAVCVGIRWKGVQDILPMVRLRLDQRARTLTLQTFHGRPLFQVDTRTFWVSRPTSHRRGFWSIFRL